MTSHRLARLVVVLALSACGSSITPSAQTDLSATSTPSPDLSGPAVTTPDLAPGPDLSSSSMEADLATSNPAPADLAGGGGLDGPNGGAAAACATAGGTVSSMDCYCPGTGDFYNLCAVGACTCSPLPANLHTVMVCNCPGSLCWNGSACVAR